MAVPMAIPASKIIAAILADKRVRTALMSVIVGVVAVIFLFVFMLLSLLALPAGGLSGIMPEEELSMLYELRSPLPACWAQGYISYSPTFGFLLKADLLAFPLVFIKRIILYNMQRALYSR